VFLLAGLQTRSSGNIAEPPSHNTLVDRTKRASIAITDCLCLLAAQQLAALSFEYGAAMKEPPFLTNAKGERIKVVIDIEDYEKILEELEDLEDIRAVDERKAASEIPIPFEQAMAEIRRNRK
jgi:hypothetical protein